MSSNAGQAAMARYDELLQMAEALWQRERAAKVPVDGGRQ
jgi:hypothetical protein